MRKLRGRKRRRERKTLRTEGDSSSDEGGDDNLGQETGDEDAVERILEDRGIGDKVEVRVRWVEGGEVTWEPVEAVRDCEAYGKFLRDRWEPRCDGTGKTPNHFKGDREPGRGPRGPT